MPASDKEEFFDSLEIMPPADRDRYLDRKLAETVDYAYKFAPAARTLFDRAVVNPAKVRQKKDLEKLPITRKTDLIEMQKQRPPYGGLATIPPEDIGRVFISPGPIYEIQPSNLKWFARSFWAAGFRKGDVVVNTFTYHLSPAGLLFQEGLRDCGATVVPTGTGNTDIQIQAMRDLKVTGFVGTPTFLMTIIKRIEETGLDLRHNFSLRRAWFTGEMLPPSLRKTFEEDYKIDTYQAYAVTEPGGAIAYECRAKAGMHLMDEYVVEIVDPPTGKQLKPGETGEIVVTPIHNKSWGLIRFGTGDLSSLTTEPCPCGRTAYRLSGILGRTGDAVKVRGMFVVGRQAEQLVMGFSQVAKFQLIIGRREHRDEVTLRLELADEDTDKAKLADEIGRKFQDACRVKIDKTEFVAAGSILEQAQKLVDERKWE